MAFYSQTSTQCRQNNAKEDSAFAIRDGINSDFEFFTISVHSMCLFMMEV